MTLIEIEEALLRLGVALALGAAIGLNRELHGKPAGLRTHALVSLGAAVAAFVALQPQVGNVPADPNGVGRVIQGILTGVGFIGAGVILRDPQGHVTGLTTAATLWLCAVLGMVCGLGHWAILVVALGLALVVLIFGRFVESAAERVFKRRGPQPPDHGV
jgi:putative Mg2+ transporter-C (MgtC) family protein